MTTLDRANDQLAITRLRRQETVRRRVRMALIFVASALVLNALVGNRGLIETFRAREQTRRLEAAAAAMRSENGRLREDTRRLREDPATIEALARRELGLLRPGEIVVFVRSRATTPYGVPQAQP